MLNHYFKDAAGAVSTKPLLLLFIYYGSIAEVWTFLMDLS